MCQRALPIPIVCWVCEPRSAADPQHFAVPDLVVPDADLESAAA